MEWHGIKKYAKMQSVSFVIHIQYWFVYCAFCHFFVLFLLFLFSVGWLDK